ncbi:hypothetical protein Bca4012_016968 [Brassica carinata]
MEVGTPKVTIPDHVLLQGVQNQKEYVIGQFHRCLMPSGGLVYAVLNRLWDRNCEISVKKLGEFSYIFHIPDEATRKWILHRSLWHVDDCIMFIAPWTSSNSLTIPEITSIPLWVTLKNIPNTLYSIFGIEWIASGLGEPMLSHKPWLDPTMLGEAKIMVEVELDRLFPQKVAAWDKQGNFSMVDVEYSWLPTPCERWGQIGHKQKRCLSISSQKTSTAGNGSMTAPVAHVFASVDAATPDKESMVPSNVPSTSQAHDEQTAAPKQSSHKDDTPKPSDQVTALNPSLEVSNGLSLGEQVGYIVASDLASLATITELENMSVPPTTVCVNEKIDSPPVEIAPPAIEQTATLVLKESSRIGELDLEANKFDSLVSSDGEEEDQLEQECDHSVDLMTPYGKRLLRERPVRPSVKAMEWQVQSTSR